MKITELREMSDDQITEHLTDLKKELFDLRFQHSIHQLDDPQKIIRVKKEISMCSQIQAERSGD